MMLQEREFADGSWREESVAFAAQCWTTPTTSHLVMEPALAEVFARLIQAWMQDAARGERNAAFYREVLRQTGDILGPETRLADDGSVMEEVLALRVPEVAKALIDRLAAPHSLSDEDRAFIDGQRRLTSPTFYGQQGARIARFIAIIDGLTTDAPQGVPAMRAPSSIDLVPVTDDPAALSDAELAEVRVWFDSWKTGIPDTLLEYICKVAFDNIGSLLSTIADRDRKLGEYRSYVNNLNELLRQKTGMGQGEIDSEAADLKAALQTGRVGWPTLEQAAEILKALGDLSFECFSPIAPCNAPSIATYNRTFEVLDRHRRMFTEALSTPKPSDTASPVIEWESHAAECPVCEQCRKPKRGAICDRKYCPWMETPSPEVVTEEEIAQAVILGSHHFIELTYARQIAKAVYARLRTRALPRLDRAKVAVWLFDNFPHDPNAKPGDPYWGSKADALLAHLHGGG